MNGTSIKHPLKVVFSGLAICVILVSLYFYAAYLWRGNSFQETNDAQVECYINPVSARVGGYIKSVSFEEHQIVAAGDTLMILDDREYLQKVKEAEAVVEDVRAQMLVLNAGIASQETASKVNTDQIEAAKARLTLQKADIDRYKKLIREEAITGADLDAVQSRFDVSRSEYSAAVNSLRTNYAKINELKTHRALLSADLKRKSALLELARINMRYTAITAPYAGKLGRKTIQEGQQIQPGQPLVLIVNEQRKWITANFKETQISKMYVGQPVEISVDAIDDKIYHGQIEAISASTGSKYSLLPPDNSTGNFVKVVQRVPVRIRFVSKDIAAVKAGMNVLVSVKNKNI
ncbi:HlyD family secretion protein [Mucilaginibacter sp. SMC90]|uniref:HlyD family secretion protein n=1 Tax=Mucilaginibacter TaxID=423349 RepID=UPI000E0D3C98|nr:MULTISPECIES: HlyD family secretion protein [Mucilaginibacter]UOE48836.1 HlyD family secretion protein [Mucilaginibacter sp. SMC90]